jgi:hypothetical protein
MRSPLISREVNPQARSDPREIQGLAMNAGDKMAAPQYTLNSN